MGERFLNKTNSVKLFTHTDLDGVSCAILAGLYFENICDVDMCDYNNINDKLKNFLSSPVKWRYNLILITDISCNEEVAEMIDKHNNPNMLNIKLIDHHKTAEWLNKYSWANVVIEKDNHLCSGTSLLAEFLGFTETLGSLPMYINLVRQYDTWEWKANNENRANDLNNLFHILGRERFINDMMDNLIKDYYIFSKEHQLLIEIDKEKKDLYFQKKEKELDGYIIDGMLFGIVFANEYVSELGNYLGEKYPNFMGIILIGEYGISYRTIHDNIDMSMIAKKFGGGGHQKASGSGISIEKRKQYLDLLFNI